MELQLYSDSLYPESRNYNSHFQLMESDFLPKVQTAIRAVRDAGGRAVFYDGCGGYVAITK